MNLCSVCGATNSPEARFCRSCGAKLGVAAPAASAPSAASKAPIPDILDELAQQTGGASMRPRPNSAEFDQTMPLPRLSDAEVAALAKKAGMQAAAPSAAAFEATMLIDRSTVNAALASVPQTSTPTPTPTSASASASAPSPAPFVANQAPAMGGIPAGFDPMGTVITPNRPGANAPASGFHFSSTPSSAPSPSQPSFTSPSSEPNSGLIIGDPMQATMVSPRGGLSSQTAGGSSSAGSDPLAALDQALSATAPPAASAQSPSVSVSATSSAAAASKPVQAGEDAAQEAAGKRLPPVVLISGVVGLVALALGAWYFTRPNLDLPPMAPPAPTELATQPTPVPPAPETVAAQPVGVPPAMPASVPEPVQVQATPVPMPTPPPPALTSPVPSSAEQAAAAAAATVAATAVVAKDEPKKDAKPKKRPPPAPVSQSGSPPPPAPAPYVAPPPPAPAPVQAPPPPPPAPRPAPKPAPPVRDTVRDIYGPG